KTYNVSLTLAANTGSLARTGHTFAGWNTATDGTGTHYESGGTYTGNAALTLYAEWTAIPHYMAKTNGDWTDAGIWFTNTIGGDNPDNYTTPAPVAPDGGNSLGIFVNADVNMDADRTIDQTTIAEGAVLSIQPGVLLTVDDGDGTDLTVTGELIGTGALVGSAGSRVLFTGGDQNVPEGDYYHLDIAGAGTKTLTGPITIAGDLDIGVQAVLDVSVSNHTLDVSGNWTNDGSFVAREGDVSFTGDQGQIILGDTSFFDLTIANAHPTDGVDASTVSALTITGALTLIDGVFIGSAQANDVTIEAGALVELTGDMTVLGHWDNRGILLHNHHAVIFDGTGQSLSGDTIFHHLTKTVSVADTLIFTAGSTTTIEGTLTLQGAAGQRLFLRSSVTDAPWTIDPQSTRALAFLDVRDSTNANASVIDVQTLNCLDSGNNSDWLFDVPPTVTTQAVTDIGPTSANGHGTITHLGIPDPTVHGFCWSTTPNPTLADNHTDDGTAVATGPFTGAVTGLEPLTAYYVRAYAVNNAGAVYGTEVSFTTLTLDSDGDGIIDSDEGDGETDTDDDGIPDIQDTDSDDDGVDDVDEGNADTDNDGISDFRDSDSDNDGMEDGIESGAANNGDGNNDGILDRLQDHVASLPTSGNERYVTFESPVGTRLTHVQATDNPSPDDMPRDRTLPIGLLDFTVRDIAPGSAVQLTLYLPEGVRAESYLKYGRTPDNPEDHWYDFNYDGRVGAEINGRVITLHFVDAETGDDVLTEDGLIIDIGGPVLISPVDGRHEDYGPGDGCFIGSLGPGPFLGTPLITLILITLGVILRRVRSPLVIALAAAVFLLSPDHAGLGRAAEEAPQRDYYLSAGAGIVHVDERISAEYLSSRHSMTVDRSICPVLRLGRRLSKHLAVELGFHWDLYSGDIDQPGEGGSGNPKSYIFSAGTVYSWGDTGSLRPLIHANLGYASLNDDLDYPSFGFESSFGGDVAVGAQYKDVELRLGYRYYVLDRDGMLPGAEPSRSSDSLDLSGFFMELAYRFHLR
ncbi:choice-of-anchor U domain-containing protein, partial [Desulfatiferula olefinivorans]